MPSNMDKMIHRAEIKRMRLAGRPKDIPENYFRAALDAPLTEMIGPQAAMNRLRRSKPWTKSKRSK